MKVYCKNCKYLFHIRRQGVFCRDFCTAIFFTKENGSTFIYETLALNYKGYCIRYKRKWWKFWIKDK